MTFFEQISDHFCRVVHTNLKIPLSCCERRINWKISKSIDLLVFFYTLNIGVLRLLINFIDFMIVFFGWPSNLLILKDFNSRRFRALTHFLLVRAYMLMIYSIVFITPHKNNIFVPLFAIIMTIDVYVIKLDMKRRGLMPLERSVPPLWEILISLCCVVAGQWLLKYLIFH
uniref:AT31812p n=1 Tax=Drosophila melanogaster TaxID=7227 RepID=Q8T8R7_DROME|eukprot:NP_727833.1 uncharacterized protein Dmel_CG32588 [Drosophila melanogaster]